MCSWTFFVRFTLPEYAIKQLTDPSSDRRGSPWKIWLNGLAEIVEEVKSLRGEGSGEKNVDHPFVQFVGELNAFPLNANATKRQSQKLSSKRDQNPENSRGIKGEDICGEHVSGEHSCLIHPDSKS